MDDQERELREAADKCICDCSDDEVCLKCGKDIIRSAAIAALFAISAWTALWLSIGIYVGAEALHHIK